MSHPDRKNDRRVHPRKVAAIPVNLRMAKGQVLATGQVRNLSLGGAFVQMKDPLPVGCEVEVEFLLPVKPRTIRCPGVVVWSSDEVGEMEAEDTGIGVELRRLGPTELKFLTNLLEPQLDDPSPQRKSI